ncbi:MobV family relaxase [Pectobacterium versatile]|uniref:MobV family relaxase n=1 Tax=Pectobacterium versatile TaxID=2488639 RepID=UPI001F1FF88C|nr:MobV family relaxase [Pectobacterium versatile]
MTEYAILRVKKLKTEVAILGSLRHTFREQPTPNADPDRLASNTLYGAESTAEAMKEFRSRLPEKVRKNAVLALEYLITASPETMQGKSRSEQDSYLSDSLEWLKEKHGSENVFCGAVHRDELTPHLAVYVMPKDDAGKLNCRKFLGDRGALRQMQTDFADRVGKRHGLRRGIEGSKAKHQTVSRFYSTIQNNEPATASKTMFGNIKPEAHGEVKNALEALLKREKAMKHREQVLDRKTSEADALIAEAKQAKDELREERQARYRAEMTLDDYKLKFEGLVAEYKVMDQARMDAIDEMRHYRDLVSNNQRDLDL